MFEDVILSRVDWSVLQEVIKKYFKVGTIVMLCQCEVFYEGRASSRASEARRLVIIKEDGTLLIHEGVGVEPINWQPNALITSKVYEDHFELVAIRSRPKEVVKVFIKDKPDVIICKLGSGKFSIRGTEEDLINYIAQNPSVIEEGAKLVAREFATPHGRVDVILRSSNDELIIVECKRGVADLDAVHQLIRYVEYYSELGIKVRGVIASPSITPQALKLLQKNNLSYVKLQLTHG
jgi:RecB family endonuclease NucS